MTTLELRTEDLITNPTPRIPVCVCVDTSGSMAGEPIEELNRGVAAFYHAVNAHELARQAAELAIVGFAGTAYTIKDFGSIAEATPPHIAIDGGGGTSLGSGVELSLDLLDQRKQAYKSAGCEYFQGWLLLLTDGQPTDDTHVHVAPRITQLVEARKLTVFPIGIGEYADLQALAMLSPKRKPLRLKGLSFVELFEFLGRSVERASESQPGDSIPVDPEDIEGWAEL